MKKIISTIVAAIVALSFSAVVFAADATPVPAPATTAPAVEKKETKPAQTHKKHLKKHKAAKKAEKKVEAPAAAPAPAAPAK